MKQEVKLVEVHVDAVATGYAVTLDCDSLSGDELSLTYRSVMTYKQACRLKEKLHNTSPLVVSDKYWF